MSVNKFGRSSLHFKHRHGFHEILCEEEDTLTLNVKKRRIANVEKPIDEYDVANKYYVDLKINEVMKKSEEEHSKLNKNIESSTSELKIEVSNENNEVLCENLKSKLSDSIIEYMNRKKIKGTADTHTTLKETDVLTFRSLLDIISLWKKKK